MDIKEKIKAELESIIDEYCREKGVKRPWLSPIIKYGDAKNPLFLKLKELVDPAHYQPTDYLPEAAAVLSYFLPFSKEISESNAGGAIASRQWALAYDITNDFAECANERLCSYVRSLGYEACPPKNAGMINDENPRSLWSQRHVAYVCGQGTFGVNNMLISDAGCVGRYYSVITTLPVETDEPVKEERCLYKKDRGCLECVKRCPAGALGPDFFDRLRCLARCDENEQYVGTGVCGKCSAGLPCAEPRF